MMGFLRIKTQNYVLIISLITVLSGLTHLFFPILLKTGIKSQMKSKESSFMLKNWQKSRIPVTLKVYVFDIENPKQVLIGQRARIKELGPYYYK
jgi:hypothetical protein